MKYEHKERIIYADTDAEGVVYYANYLKFFERGRMELLRQMGVSIVELKEKENILFAINKVECEYKAPAVLDDEITIATEIKGTTATRVVFSQQALRGDQLLVAANISACAVSTEDFKPTRLPKIFSN
jgi:acyl-CoA thioester hydrolase